MRKIVFLLLFCPTLLSSAFWNWHYISSDHFEGYYQSGQKQQAIKGLYFLEKHKGRIDSLTGFQGTGAFNLGYHFLETPKLFSSAQIKQKIFIVFQDMGDANGYANPLKPKISLFANQLRADDFVFGESWYRIVAVHEYTHIAQMSARQGSVLAAILGNWVSPNIYHPLWLLEGYTVYSESQVAPGEGRLSSGTFSAIAGSQKFFGQLPTLTQLTFYDSHKFPASAQYLYGGLLIDYLSKTYGEESLRSYVDQVDEQGFCGILNILFPHFFMDDVAQTVFGAEFATLYRKALEDLPANPSDTKKELAGLEAGSVQEFLVQDGVCYYTLAELSVYGFPLSKLYRWEQGRSQFLKNLPYAGDHSFQLVKGNLYYRKAVLGRGFANIEQLGSGSQKHLFRLNLEKKDEDLLIGEDVQSFVVDTLGTVYFSLSAEDGYGSKVYQKVAGKKPELLFRCDEYISQMSCDGESFVFTAKAELGSLGLYSWQKGQTKLIKLLNSLWAEISPTLSGNQLVYTANYEGKLAGYRYNLKSKKVKKITDAAFAKSVRSEQNLVYYLGLGKDGFRLCQDTLAQVDFVLPADQAQQQVDFSQFNYSEKGNAALRNLASILVPDIRVPPIFQQGADILGTTQYVFSFGDELSLTALTTIFDPLILSLSYQTPEHFLGQSYLPLYSALGFGLKSVYLLGGYEYEKNEDKIFAQSEETFFAGLNLNFNFPHDLFKITATYDDQEDIDANLQYEHYFFAAKIALSAQVSKLSDQDLLWEEKEKEASLFYLQRICRIDKGLWTPSFFVRDLAVKFFGEYQKEELSGNSHQQDIEFGLGLVPRLLTLQGNLLGELELGARWAKQDAHSDYQPEFYTKLVLSY